MRPLRADEVIERVKRDDVGAVQVRVDPVGAAQPPVGDVAEEVGGEQRRRHQHECVDRGDADQHGAARQELGRTQRDGIGQEHEDHRGDQPGQADVQPDVSESAGEAAEALAQRLGQEQLRVRGRERDQQGCDEHAAETDQARGGREATGHARTRRAQLERAAVMRGPKRLASPHRTDDCSRTGGMSAAVLNATTFGVGCKNGVSFHYVKTFIVLPRYRRSLTPLRRRGGGPTCRGSATGVSSPVAGCR